MTAGERHMTAAELIRRLQELPPDAELSMTADPDGEGASLYSWVTGTFDDAVELWSTRTDAEASR